MIIRIAAAITAALSACFAIGAGSFGEVSQTYMPRPDCIRLHVIANSDEDDDQRVKLLVRDALLSAVRESMTAASPEEAEKELASLGETLQSEAERALRENGADYGAQLIAGEFFFPDREYGGEYYPAGRYKALRVVLGEGEGHNWWCVMFPPLCVIETGGEPARYNEDGTLRFRSFFAELWKELFGA